MLAGSAVGVSQVALASYSAPYPDNHDQATANNTSGAYNGDVGTAISWSKARWSGEGTSHGGAAFSLVSGSYDIHNYVGYRGGLGVSDCVDTNWWNGLCNTFNLKYDETQLGHDANAWKKTGCHEHGHTFGLDERSSGSSCMRQGYFNDGTHLYPDATDLSDMGWVSTFV